MANRRCAATGGARPAFVLEGPSGPTTAWLLVSRSSSELAPILGSRTHWLLVHGRIGAGRAVAARAREQQRHRDSRNSISSRCLRWTRSAWSTAGAPLLPPARCRSVAWSAARWGWRGAVRARKRIDVPHACDFGPLSIATTCVRAGCTGRRGRCHTLAGRPGSPSGLRGSRVPGGCRTRPVVRRRARGPRQGGRRSGSARRL
jgi:hypothetical protein